MNVRIGDIVRFISEKLEGKVTGIIDANSVNVYCDEYGFEIPASINDLVVIHSDFHATTVSVATDIPVQAQRGVEMSSSDTLYLAFVPENFNNLNESRFDLYLVNDTNLVSLCSVAFYDGKRYNGITAGNCNPDAAYLVGNYSLKELDGVKSIQVQAIFYQKGYFTFKSAIDVPVKLNPVSLCKAGAYKHVRWFEPVAFVRPLEKESSITERVDLEAKQLLQASKKEMDELPGRRPAKQMVGNMLEIDLHISQLLETTAGMENKDMLEYQLDVFRKTLEEYKLRRGQKIIFIHGKGDGVLKQRILWELQTKYKRFQHQDASFKQYGYGATMVTIK
ncbi:Smr/MutS family protein [Gabonibacter chumensis]|uniref:Smr/MutS family protein n=1 Tax=Gabonibacter chumensis TaxID=2972474 RepID=UPI0025726ED7|nr:DUF2027 domain-containing protein [Gabonibacter chumensis]MCR9012891.1 DUF2027 domain-containing protein [Gabonibacter chumensis]